MSSLSDTSFTGVITISYSKLHTEKGLEWFNKTEEVKSTLRHRFSNQSKWKEDYEFGLVREIKYYINGDTLIMFSINVIGDTLTSRVQIKKDSYVKSKGKENFTKMNIPHLIEHIKSWKSLKRHINNHHVKSYIGSYQNAINTISVDYTHKYNHQSLLPFDFKDVFYEGGIIIYKNEIYDLQGLNRTYETIDINPMSINCQDIMDKLSFTPNEYEKPLTVNRIFYASDTVILHSDLRPKANVYIYTSEVDSMALEDLPGDYKYIAFVHNSYNKIKLMDDFKDLNTTYRDKNIRCYIVEINENISNKYNVPPIDAHIDRNEKSYFFKQGIIHPLFAKIDFIVYPIYFLFDKGGKIVLVEAPPPSDPNLCTVLDRLE